MKALLFSLALTVVFVSCGKPESDIAEDNFYNQYKSGACGLDVISDYNSVVLDCKYMRTMPDLLECESKALQFSQKYSGISCKAERGYGLSKESVYIEQYQIDNLLEEIQNAKEAL